MKQILKSCTALTLSMALVAPAFAQEPPKELGPGEGALSIVAWAGYIERGETDKNYDWVTISRARRDARSASRRRQPRMRWSL